MANSQNQTTIELEACTNDAQELLIDGFNNRNLEQFRFALSKGGNPNVIINDTKMSIFDSACFKPGCHEFIKACLDEGCDVNNYNEEMHKRPLNFAAESMDVYNIATLLTRPEIDVNTQFNSLTPIHRVIKYLEEENFEHVFESVKLFVKHHANVNIPDKQMATLIVTAAKKKVSGVEQIIGYLLKNTNVDIDTQRNGEARKLIAKSFPNLSLPSLKTNGKQIIDFYYLIHLIKEKKESQFIRDLQQFMTSDNRLNKTDIFKEDDGDKTMLEYAVQEGLFEIVKTILAFGASVNYSKSISYSPIGLACYYGHHEILEFLLDQPDIKLNNCDDPLLCIVIKKLGGSSDLNYKACHYTKCFKLILNIPGMDVNAIDMTGSNALHYAVKYKNEDAILALLERSVYIGTENCVYDLPICDIDPNILEKYFDSCISTNNCRPGDQNFEIIFDYSCLNPTPKNTKFDGRKSHYPKRQPEEMVPIDYLAKNPDLKYLIKHPLISSFLWLKWHRLGMIFYTNFLLYTFFCISFILYVVFCYEIDRISHGVSSLLYSLSLLGVFYVVIRELLQFLMSPTNYFKTLENYLELALIVVTIIVLFYNDFDEDGQRNIAAIAILLVAAEFSLLIGSLPIMSISTHMVMLKTVSISFVKSLTLYSIIIISFALSFYKLIGGNHVHTHDEDYIVNGTIIHGKKDEDDERFNKFLDPGTAIIKTIVMLTGEYEAANINFEDSYTCYIIFLLFVFFISIVLLNLLNGLAVSDTQAIKSEAELTGFIYRAQLLSRYEKIILGKWLHKYKAGNPISLFPEFLPINKLILLPNDSYNVYIPQSKNTKESIKKHLTEFHYQKFEKKLIDSPMKPLICCFCSRSCSRMDNDIIKCTSKVLGNKIRHEGKLKQKYELKERICRIEEKMDSIEKLLRQVLEKY